MSAIKMIGSDNFFGMLLNENITGVVKFSAPWCGPCLLLKEVIERIAENNPGIDFFTCNTDENQDIITKLGVTSIPTLIFYKNGKEIERRKGNIPEPQIIEVIEKKLL